jgi:RNA polymerase sigma factor (sigma-70 family)
MEDELQPGPPERLASIAVEGRPEEPGPSGSAAARRGGSGAREGRARIRPESRREIAPDCEPPPPADPLRQHLSAGAGPRGEAPDDALLALLDDSREPLRALFKQLGVKPDDSQDLLQKALLVVTLRWRGIRNPLGYLLGTVKKLSQVRWRELRSEGEVLLALSQLEGAAAGEIPQLQVERRLEAQQLLARVPAAARRTLELYYGEEMSWQEVARELDCSAAAARQAASRAVRRLRRYAVAAGRRF